MTAMKDRELTAGSGLTPKAAVERLIDLSDATTASLREALETFLKHRMPPSPERRAKSWFKARFVGSGGGKRVTTEVSGGDPGYEETAKMLGECALSLALDDLPKTSGQTTTAAAMGPALRDRLIRAGITFRVVSTEDY